MKLETAKRQTQDQTLVLKMFSTILAVSFFFGFTKLCRAETSIISYETIQNTEILYRSESTDTTQKLLFENLNLKNVEKAVQALQSDAHFAKLPPHFILIDPTWSKSGGYFSPGLKAGSKPGILLSLSNLTTDAQAKKIIAHELAHLLFYQTHPNEAPWVSEGVAMLTEFLSTHALSSSIQDAFLYPEVSLTGSFDPLQDTYQDQTHQAAQYGNVQLYFLYLYRNCGQEQFVNFLFSADNAQDRMLDKFLAQADCGAGKTFLESFKNFAIAKAMQDLSDPLKYVFMNGTQMEVLDHPALLSEPFSETLYRIREGEHCKAGETSWGSRRCIRIRDY